MSSKTPPMTFQWDGEAMVPERPKLADRYFVVGEAYTFIEHEQHSPRSRGHLFAIIDETWKNLPDHLRVQWPTTTHLRKHALIKGGFYDVTTIICRTSSEARRWAAFMGPRDEYSVIVDQGNLISIYEAKSQAISEMKPKEFQAAKQAILAFLSDLIGVTPQALEDNAERAVA